MFQIQNESEREYRRERFKQELALLGLDDDVPPAPKYFTLNHAQTAQESEPEFWLEANRALARIEDEIIVFRQRGEVPELLYGNVGEEETVEDADQDPPLSPRHFLPPRKHGEGLYGNVTELLEPAPLAPRWYLPPRT